MSNELGNTPADKNYKPSGISEAEEAAQQYYDDNSICCSESLTKEIFIAGYEAAEKGLADKAKYSSGWDGFFYGKGYEQAEKDNALTWEDVQLLYIITRQYESEINRNLEYFPSSSQEMFEEILRRFKEAKQ